MPTGWTAVERRGEEAFEAPCPSDELERLGPADACPCEAAASGLLPDAGDDAASREETDDAGAALGAVRAASRACSTARGKRAPAECAVDGRAVLLAEAPCDDDGLADAVRSGSVSSSSLPLDDSVNMATEREAGSDLRGPGRGRGKVEG